MGSSRIMEDRQESLTVHLINNNNTEAQEAQTYYVVM